MANNGLVMDEYGWRVGCKFSELTAVHDKWKTVEEEGVEWKGWEVHGK